MWVSTDTMLDLHRIQHADRIADAARRARKQPRQESPVIAIAVPGRTVAAR